MSSLPDLVQIVEPNSVEVELELELENLEMEKIKETIVKNHIVNKDMMTRIIALMNVRIIQSYKVGYAHSDRIDFLETRSEHELNIIEKCIQIMKTHYGKKYPKKIIYTSIIYYYYSVNVLEYYLKIFIKHYIIKKDRDEMERLILAITSSDELWASQIRRLVYNFS